MRIKLIFKENISNKMPYYSQVQILYLLRMGTTNLNWTSKAHRKGEGQFLLCKKISLVDWIQSSTLLSFFIHSPHVLPTPQENCCLPGTDPSRHSKVIIYILHSLGKPSSNRRSEIQSLTMEYELNFKRVKKGIVQKNPRNGKVLMCFIW